MKKRTNTDMLNCVAKRHFTWEINDETGYVLIIRPKFISPFWQKIFNPFLKSKHFRIKLDELGSAVWLAMDGKNTIEDIGKILGEQFGKEIEPIYERLIKFTLQLHREKFIDILCPEK
jgi:hypothetical protein